MELSSTFEERARWMEDTRNHRMSRLQAEKEIQAAKSRLLAAKAAAARLLERRRLLLERRAMDLASHALAARTDIDATHARRLAVARDISSTNGEIEVAQQKAEEWDRFYESKRKEMEEFRAMSQQFEAGARQEVQRLKASVSQLHAALQELQSSGLHWDDAGIGAAEARKADLMAKKAKLDETLAAARQFRALLRQQLQKAFTSQVRDQKAAQN
ncbi:hypothetical protein CFC21_110176 [Triticum aestivum]|uniref:Uncharacterized protein n=2 Tax=Triticum aestivum TaxID=4565 RepID=A0A9R1NDN2_WHEAT|nr:uncharacterized protein LOC123171184 [Triticum aestivum]KAF7110006.1 hypothetical protein CFC21_110175 [Triticum aestivum]KAF7110007.1 hypothetical protein CFC21_110176 [Triticum aestivum]